MKWHGTVKVVHPSLSPSICITINVLFRESAKLISTTEIGDLYQAHQRCGEGSLMAAPSALGLLKWPSTLLTLVAPLIAYPTLNPPEPPMRRCGSLHTSEGSFTVYAGAGYNGSMDLRFVPLDESLREQASSGQLPEGGHSNNGSWKVVGVAEASYRALDKRREMPAHITSIQCY